ncbi:MAG: 2-amino-4-hydroxy-6-hydroxymethyldihydropteridine diphosphokinase [Bacteroidetes bacterium HGW-Bacteroidetes-4]|jgi:2-amino-4-hydroxy-6-hydroxymethyldihydropteridine diphosphokinase|nr:MAG: 2-amino-4-hydroxy-6-hydroxymethyldihydropteridine diphosphokinase [Bacteroidetes bacterium HGW-Bacteroidetes-4]
MEKVFLELGGNQGDRWQLLADAIKLIGDRVGTIVGQSSVYETPPWGFESRDFFLNQVIQVITPLEPVALIQELQLIERSLGRVREAQQYASRSMDIDLLFYGNRVLQTDNLQVPHPRLHLRNFVLLPLCEIDPDFVHPVLKKNIAELLAACSDESKCLKFSKD